MANTAKRKTIHLFNCDKLCSLSEVESLLKAVEKNVAFKISKIVKHQFTTGQIAEIAEIAEKKIPNLRGMDYAVFVVHAHECSLSFNEDSGYGKIYAALLKRARSGENILLVIGGDDNYKDDNERERRVLSRWARESAISRQFRADLIDGRKSFIFSWNKEHRPIHEEALRHLFDPSKKGQKFNYEPKPQRPQSVPQAEVHGDVCQPAAVDFQLQEGAGIPQELANEEEAVGAGGDEQDGGNSPSGEIKGSETQVPNEVSSPCSSDTKMLDTYLRYGEISFASEDVLTYRDRSWRPPESEKQKLKQKWGSTRLMRLTIFVDQSGKIKKVNVQSTNWEYCLIS